MSSISCTDKKTISFDIPKGSAHVTLKEFAAQAKSEIVFDHRGDISVETKAVRGRMIPETALEMMLKGTGLTYVRDTQSSAFAVSFSLENPDPSANQFNTPVY